MDEYIYGRAAAAIKSADALLITSGAGMGVDSGLPDFRGNEGFWKAYPPIGKLGISFSEMANPYWFDRDPRLAWGFYGHRLQLYRNTVPHEGFSWLLQQAQNKQGGYFVYTSNVDGQFQKAGFAAENIDECHGSIHHLQCTAPCSRDIWPADDLSVAIDPDSFLFQGEFPRCPKCGAIARPNILMFGDIAWLNDRTRVQSEQHYAWKNRTKLHNYRVAIIEMGAGKAVPTVRLNSQRAARELKATLIRINPRDHDVPDGHIGIAGGTVESLRNIAEAMHE